MSDPRNSLTDRLAQHVARAARVRPALAVTDVKLAVALAAIIALAPLLTIVGANMLRVGGEADNRVAERQLRSRLAPQAARREGAAALRDAVRQPALVATLERLARTLPDDARLVSAARTADGRVEIEVSASDPDQLRGALRRDPALAAMRETGQRRTQDARVVVTLRSRA